MGAGLNGNFFQSFAISLVTLPLSNIAHVEFCTRQKLFQDSPMFQSKSQVSVSNNFLSTCEVELAGFVINKLHRGITTFISG